MEERAVFHVMDDDRVELEDMAGIEVKEENKKRIGRRPPPKGIELGLNGEKEAVFQNVAVEGHDLGVSSTRDLDRQTAERGGENPAADAQHGVGRFMSEDRHGDRWMITEKHLLEAVKGTRAEHHVVVHEDGVFIVRALPRQFREAIAAFTPCAMIEEFGAFAGFVPRKKSGMGRRAIRQGAEGKQTTGGRLNEVEEGFFHSWTWCQNKRGAVAKSSWDFGGWGSR